jgi:hypothetical protein
MFCDVVGCQKWDSSNLTAACAAHLDRSLCSSIGLFYSDSANLTAARAAHASVSSSSGGENNSKVLYIVAL